jgi:hypothetical protein
MEQCNDMSVQEDLSDVAFVEKPNLDSCLIQLFSFSIPTIIPCVSCQLIHELDTLRERILGDHETLSSYCEV